MKTVLFVCIGNSCRSQMAKGFFNTFTSSEAADSAGMKPEDHVDSTAIQVMKEVDIDITGYTPKLLTSDMNNKFDIIVTMGCVNGCPLTPRQKTLEWEIEDPKGKSLGTYREVRNTIRNYVEKLIMEMKERTHAEGKSA